MIKDLERRSNIVETIHCLLTGFYKIEICPVCGHIYFGRNSICNHCKYEPLFDLDVDEYKKNYLEVKNGNR